MRSNLKSALASLLNQTPVCLRSILRMISFPHVMLGNSKNRNQIQPIGMIASHERIQTR